MGCDSSIPVYSEPFGACSSLPEGPPESFACPGPLGDPAKNSLFPSSADHESPVAVPLRSSRNALIFFFFMPLRTFSFTTKGYTPSLNFIFQSLAQSTLCERTNCALFRCNSFPWHTCVFDGGRGGMSSTEPYSESTVGLPDRVGACSKRALQRRREEPGCAERGSGQEVANSGAEYRKG
jgi:hypothetical protein